jgi:hypothetical protein
VRRLPVAVLVVLALTVLVLLVPQFASGKPKSGVCPPGFGPDTPIEGDLNMNGDQTVCVMTLPGTAHPVSIEIDNVAQIPG